MIAAVDFMQRRLRTQRRDDGLEKTEVGESVSRSLEKQHGDGDAAEMFGALGRWLLIGMQGKAEEGQSLHTRQRSLGLRLRCHAPAE